jgi:hypothetical protein
VNAPIRRVGSDACAAATAVLDELTAVLHPDETVTAIVIMILTRSGRGVNQRWRWHCQLASTAQLVAPRPMLFSDAATALRQLATAESDA